MRSLLIVLFVVAATVMAEPHIGYIYPAGAQVGSKVRLLIGGQHLQGVHSGIVSGDGVITAKVTRVKGFPYPVGKQRGYLLNWIKNIESGKPEKPPFPENEDLEGWRKHPWWDQLDQLDELSLKLVLRNLVIKHNPLQAAPALSQLAIVDLEIAPDATPGMREFRIWGNQGVSAPNLFYIDSAPHIAEPRFTPPGMARPLPSTAETFPVVLNGQIMPGETDRFPVRLNAGKDYTFSLTGRKLHPFLGDAVPGHFQPVLRLLDPQGREVAFADDEYFNPDPVLRFRASADGVYTLEVRDNLYRGREDFVYRIMAEAGLTPYRMALPELTDKAVPAVLSAEKPISLSGVIAKPGDQAVYRINGRAGQKIVCRVLARQFGSPLDGILFLSGPDGKVIAEVDDSPSELNIGEIPQQLDPCLAVTLPGDGEYKLVLTDTANAGGVDYRYLLQIGPPQPDFTVYTSKSMLNLRPGAVGRIKLYITYTDGFKESLLVYTEDDSMVGDVIIAPGDTEFTVYMKNKAEIFMKPRPVRLMVKVVGAGVNKQVVKPVIPADEFIQAFAYTHLLPAQEFYLGTIKPPKK